MDEHNIHLDMLNAGPTIYMGISYTGVWEQINDVNTEVQFG
jgi:hypothetical protein